jgi:hypothetical protein
MLDVHSRIHEVKKTVVRDRESTKPQPFDPIPPVARSISHNLWLICFDEFQVIDDMVSVYNMLIILYKYLRAGCSDSYHFIWKATIFYFLEKLKCGIFYILFGDMASMHLWIIITPDVTQQLAR